MLDERTKRTVPNFQTTEAAEHVVYKALAEKTKGADANALERIAEDELRHSNEWKEFTQTETHPNNPTVWNFLIISRLIGLTFAIEIMEERGGGGSRESLC